MKRTKKKLALCAGLAALLVVLVVGWNCWFSSTKVAFINYQIINFGEISKANDNSFIKISELSVDELDRIGSYDMVFIVRP